MLQCMEYCATGHRVSWLSAAMILAMPQIAAGMDGVISVAANAFQGYFQRW